MKILIVINLILISFLAVFHYFAFIDSRTFILNQYKTNMKTAVAVPYSLAEDFEQNFRNMTGLSQSIVQEEFLSLISKMKYDKNEVFFILDGDGNMITNPLRPSLSWWNMNYEIDGGGKYLFRDFINTAKRDGEIYLQTNWQSKYSDQIYEDQIIYGKYFWPWDWVICTTLYNEDIHIDNLIMSKKGLLSVIIMFISLNIIIFILTRKTKV